MSEKTNIVKDSASSATKAFFGGLTGSIGVVIGIIVLLLLLCCSCTFLIALPSAIHESNQDLQQQK